MRPSRTSAHRARDRDRAARRLVARAGAGRRDDQPRDPARRPSRCPPAGFRRTRIPSTTRRCSAASRPAVAGSRDAASDATQFPRALLNTALLTVVSTLIVLLIAVLAGYGFARLEFKGRQAAALGRAGDDDRPDLHAGRRALPPARRVRPDQHLPRNGLGVRQHHRAAGDLALLQLHARTAAGARGGGADRRLHPLWGLPPRRPAADDLRDRGAHRDRDARGLGPVPDPAALDLDPGDEAGDGGDHRVHRQVHDELPAADRGRGARR